MAQKRLHPAYRYWGFGLLMFILNFVFSIFFREIKARGVFRIPKTGPVIFVGAPHANQFCDPPLLMLGPYKEFGRCISFLIAAKSYAHRWIGLMASFAMAIPVSRAQDNLKPATGKIFLKDPENEPLRITGEGTKFTTECMAKGLLGLPRATGNSDIAEVISDTELILRKEFKNPKAIEMLRAGTSFKTADKVDQNAVYNAVFAHLSAGECIGIFPEGGSHDRPDLLPLKAGVAIMALGAMARDEKCDVKIVPCGMNYFHRNKFRSRAVIEYGMPMSIDKSLVEKYKNPETNKEAVRELLDAIQDGLKAVTVTCPDYETLVVVQTARRLFTANFRVKVPLSFVIELNRNLVRGYEHYAQDPRVANLREQILAYDRRLHQLGLKDHQVETAQRSQRQRVALLVVRITEMLFLLLGALPGFVLFSPVFIAAKIISRKKQREALAASTVKVKAMDVIASWKVLVAMGLAPLLYNVYTLLAMYIVYRRNLLPFLVTGPWSFTRGITVFLSGWIIFPAITWAALLFGERGMDVLKSVYPLYLCLFRGPRDAVLQLKQERERLMQEVTEVVNFFGPQMYPDYHERIAKLATGQFVPSRRSSLMDNSAGTVQVEAAKKELEGMRGTEGTEETEETEENGLSRVNSATSATSATTVESSAISRVNSSNSLSNIPIFNEYLGVHTGRKGSDAGSVASSGTGGTSGSSGVSTGVSTGVSKGEQLNLELSQRVTSALSERRRKEEEEEEN